jgi:hypothetical protein
VAAGDDVEEVANDGAGGRGDDAHGAGKCGQRLLAFGVEQAFGLEALFELLEGQLQGAGADGLHGFGHQLHLAALLVDADAAAHQDVQAVFGAEAQQHGLAAEEDNGQLRVGVLEREVEVAGGRGTEVGDFAFDPDVAVFLLDELADLADEFANRPDAASTGLTLNRMDDIRRMVTKATTRPQAAPMAVRPNPWRTNRPVSSLRCAPRAMRMPISRVRCETV